MASRHDPDASTTTFLVERYLAPGDAGELPASVARVARLCAAGRLAGVDIQYLHSAYLPTEDTCFCVFRAPSPDAVRAVNTEGDFALDRITDAIVLFPRGLQAPPIPSEQP